MSSTHRSSHHSSTSSKSRHSSSKSKSKKDDDWSEITDPEERRRVQNRIAQRKFRDKAKEVKEREERDAINRDNAGNSYRTLEPEEMSNESELSGLPWGSVSMRHVLSKGKTREEESRRSSGTHEDKKSHYGAQDPVYEPDGYYEQDPSYFDEGDKAYYDYGSGGSRGGNSR